MIMLRRQPSFDFLEEDVERLSPRTINHAAISPRGNDRSSLRNSLEEEKVGSRSFVNRAYSSFETGSTALSSGNGIQNVSPRPFGGSLENYRIVDTVDVASDINLLQEQDILIECLQPLLLGGRKRKLNEVDFNEHSFNQYPQLDNIEQRVEKKNISKSSPSSGPIIDTMNYYSPTNRAASTTGFGTTSIDATVGSSSIATAKTAPASLPARDDEEESSIGSESSGEERRGSDVDLKEYQTALWQTRFDELCEYQKIHGNCNVPHTWKKNPSLAKWIKRQRYQYKLKSLGKHSTLTAEREKTLDDMGFIWDSHKATWEEKFEQLLEFKNIHGHCSVPSKYKENHSLSVWVQCQRRQYRLFQGQRERSSMNAYRIAKLESIGFEWVPAGNRVRSSSTP